MLIHHPVFVVLIAAVLAPLLAQLPVGRRIPIVVLEVLLGILVGPHILDWIRFDGFVSSMQAIGMAAVLFMAGMEIDFGRFGRTAVGFALRGWTLSLILALAAVMVLHVLPGVHAPLMIAIALSTTSLGALIPILRDSGQLETPFGTMVLAAGTVGEVGPIVAVSLALSNRFSTWQEFAFLLAFLAIVGIACLVGLGARPPRLIAMLGRTMESSSQLPVRFALLILSALFVLSQEFGFEGILGAFAAGMIVGLATRGEPGKTFRLKIDAVCFGWFTPFFFVGTGIGFDLHALTRDALTIALIPTILVLFLIVRGVPALLARRQLPRSQLLPLGLMCSVASLGLVVVITQIGLEAKSMSHDIAQALISAALLSSLLFPVIAGRLLPKSSTAGSSAVDADQVA